MHDRTRSMLEHAMAWYSRSAAPLSLRGIDITLKGPTSGRNKNSVTVEIVAQPALVAVTIWDSGEFEIIRAWSDDANDPRVDVGQLITESQVGEMLVETIESVRRR